MYQCSGLFSDGPGNGRMGMPEPAHGNTAECVEVLPVFIVPQPDTFTPLKLDRKTVIGRHKMICHFLPCPK
jgi:hypothetical protein